jgi:hypothetical protein
MCATGAKWIYVGKRDLHTSILSAGLAAPQRLPAMPHTELYWLPRLEVAVQQLDTVLLYISQTLMRHMPIAVTLRAALARCCELSPDRGTLPTTQDSP